VALPQPQYNPCTQLAALEALLRKLPKVTDPVPRRLDRDLPNRAKQLKEAEAEAVVRAYQAGATVYELGRRFGIHRTTVSDILHRQGVAMRMGGLSSRQVDEAVKLYEEGWSLARIGKRLGVSDGTVRSRLVERGVRMRPRQGGR
jgi:DNA-directed RNA polymerase specialized sigma24 family protein